MGKQAVDIVFVIDASSGMRPFLDSLKVRLREFLQQFRDDGTCSLRLGLLAHNAHFDNGRWVYRNMCVRGDGPENMRILYGNDDDAKTSLFTRPDDGLVDVEGFCDGLDRIDCSGEKNSLLALDCAADFPFRPLYSICRDPEYPKETMVSSSYPFVIMFTNDKFESGVLKDVPIDRTLALLERVMEKINKRHIALYLFAPHSDAAHLISEFARTWVDFDHELNRFGEILVSEILRSISGWEDVWGANYYYLLDKWEREKDAYEKAVLGQDKWTDDRWVGHRFSHCIHRQKQKGKTKMTEEKRADVVFVIDASDSMKPCFDKLRSSLKSFIQPFREAGFDSLRLGLLAYKAAPNNGQWAYFHSCVNGDDPNNMKILYGDDDDAKNALFTREGDPDVDGFCRRLDSISCSADENSPLALDCAADFPFEPLCSARRVIVMFTDEKFETGVLKNDPIGPDCSVLERVMNKIVKRHITLYLFAPECKATDMMGEFSRVYIRNVPAFVEGQSGRTDTWDQIDFEKVLEGIGRSVSSKVREVVDEGPFDRAVYGQDKWKLTDWGAAATGGGVIDITNVKEGCALDMSEPIVWLNAKLHWRTPVDLDLHAFVRLTDGSCHEVSFRDRDDGYMSLDNDAGIGNVLDNPDGNKENIRCRRLDGIDRILFATKIFNEKGCFSDYNGSVEVTTSNPRQPMINVNMQSDENKTWCVIAMLDNSDPRAPRVFPINQVMSDDPDVNDPQWRNVGR